MRTTRMILALILATLVSACIDQSSRINQQAALDIAWQELLPSTASQTRENWAIGEVMRVYGRDVVSEFADARFTNCPGPMPPENQAIKSSSEYWYILALPRPATPFPLDDTDTTDSPPMIPEPLLREVYFLIDAIDGRIIARKFLCVEY